MGLIRWLVQLLLIVLIVRFVMRVISGVGRRSHVPPSPKRPTERVGGALVRDPQCGTHIPMASAVTHASGASMQYFCSVGCRDAWLASKAR